MRIYAHVPLIGDARVIHLPAWGKFSCEFFPCKSHFSTATFSPVVARCPQSPSPASLLTTSFFCCSFFPFGIVLKVFACGFPCIAFLLFSFNIFVSTSFAAAGPLASFTSIVSPTSNLLFLTIFLFSFHTPIVSSAEPLFISYSQQSISEDENITTGRITSEEKKEWQTPTGEATLGKMDEENEEEEEEERNNWAVIVSTSRFWHNYRHTSNALTIYFAVKRLGIPDSRIILMVADDHACNTRNPFPGQIFNSPRRLFNLYGVTAPSVATVEQRDHLFEKARAAVNDISTGSYDDFDDNDDETDAAKHFEKITSFFASSSTAFSSSQASFSPYTSVSRSINSSNNNRYTLSDGLLFPSTGLSTDVEVDYRGEEVRVQALLRLLSGRHAAETPRGQRLLSDSRSHVLVFLTGHGGENFLKFQDWEEIGAVDIADAVAQMHQQQRYKRLLLIVETCNGSTLLDSLYSPNTLGLSSSSADESSYSHHADVSLGVSVVDRWTYYTLRFIRRYVFKKRRHSYAPPESVAGANNSDTEIQWHYADADDDYEEEEEEEKEEEEDDYDDDDDDRVYYNDLKKRGKPSRSYPSKTTSEWRKGEKQQQKKGTEYGKRGKRWQAKRKRRAKTLADMLKSYKVEKLLSTATARADLFDKPLDKTRIDEFFSAATGVVIPTLRPCWLPPLQDVNRQRIQWQQQQQPLQLQQQQQQGREQQRLEDEDEEKEYERQLDKYNWVIERERHYNSFPCFDVLPYYRETFLCLVCDNNEEKTPPLKATALPLTSDYYQHGHKEEMQQQQGESGRKSQQKHKQQQQREWHRREESRLYKSTPRGRSLCRTEDDNSMCRAEQHTNTRENDFVNKKEMRQNPSNVSGYSSYNKREGDEEQTSFQHFSGTLQAAAAGAAALFVAAITSCRL